MSETQKTPPPRKSGFLRRIFFKIVILSIFFIVAAGFVWYQQDELPARVENPLLHLQETFLNSGEFDAIPSNLQLPFLAGVMAVALAVLLYIAKFTLARPKTVGVILVAAIVGGGYYFWDDITSGEKINQIVARYLKDNDIEEISKEFEQWLKKDQPDAIQEETLHRVSQITNEVPTRENDFKQGFNLLKMHPFKMEIKGHGGVRLFAKRNVKEDSYYEKNGFIVAPDILLSPLRSGGGQSTTSVFYSDSERQDGFSFNIGGGGEVKGVKVGAESSYSENLTQSNSKQDISMVSVAYETKYWLTLNKSKIKLDKGLVETLLAMKPEDYDSYNDLFEKYGTHYSVASLYGSMISEESTFSSEAFADEVMKSVGTEISGEAKGVSVNVGWGATEGNKNGVGHSKQSTNWIRSGGVGNNVQTFAPGQPSEYAPIRVILRSIGEIIHPELVSRTLTDSQRTHLDNIRANTPKMLEKYLRKYHSKATTGTAKPRVFEWKFVSLKITEEDDAGSGPDLGGLIYATTRHASSIVWARQTVAQDTNVLSPANSEETWENKTVNSSLITQVPAVLSKKSNSYEHDLSGYQLIVNVHLTDIDDTSGDDLLIAQKTFELPANGGNQILSFPVSADGVGKGTVKFSIREVEIDAGKSLPKLADPPYIKKS